MVAGGPGWNKALLSWRERRDPDRALHARRALDNSAQAIGNLPVALVIWIIYVLIYQQAENYILQPQIQKAGGPS